ncbi:caspase domain-containing protein [Mycena rebaudengoi]|nr:caspase domain-containing protein [Mycena rebaudengoi]
MFLGPTRAFLAQVGLGLVRASLGLNLLAPRRRALLIGVRTGLPGEDELDGPPDDVRALKSLLIDTFGYKEEDIVMLVEDPNSAPDAPGQPTYAHILSELDLLMKDQKLGDKFVFGYSGHSYQKENLDGTEEDGRDEFIIPSDASDFSNGDYSKIILDDVLERKLVKALLPGNQLVAILDTCHSATLLDLPHSKCNRTRSWGSIVRRSIRTVRELLPEHERVVPTIMSGILVTPMNFGILARAGSELSEKLNTQLKKIKFCSGYCRRPSEPMRIPVLCISACKDLETIHEDPAGMSLTRAFVDYLSNHPAPTLSELMDACGDKSDSTIRAMRKEYGRNCCAPWHPQLSSLEPLNMRTTFTL